MRYALLLAYPLVISCATAPGPAAVCPEMPPVPNLPDPVVTVRAYLDATAQGDLDKAAALVRDDSSVFESGGNEGTWAHYRDHHLAPELDAFASFEIRPGEARPSTSEDGSLAVVTLPLEYDITLKDERRIESKGTVTFALRLEGEAYRIEHVHWSSRRRKPASPPADLLALERKAYERAKPAFDRHCGGCHAKSGKNTKKTTRAHFDMTSYPFEGHHSSEIGAEVRRVLGADGGKATMPLGKPGSLEGEDLELLLAWTEAFAKAEAAGLHEQPARDGHGHEHGH